MRKTERLRILYFLERIKAVTGTYKISLDVKRKCDYIKSIVEADEVMHMSNKFLTKHWKEYNKKNKKVR